MLAGGAPGTGEIGSDSDLDLLDSNVARIGIKIGFKPNNANYTCHGSKTYFFSSSLNTQRTKKMPAATTTMVITIPTGDLIFSTNSSIIPMLNTYLKLFYSMAI